MTSSVFSVDNCVESVRFDIESTRKPRIELVLQDRVGAALVANATDVRKHHGLVAARLAGGGVREIDAVGKPCCYRETAIMPTSRRH